MVFESTAVHKNVVEENQSTLTQQRVESGIHGALEGIWCAGQSEGHDSKLKLTPMCLECCFMFFTGCQTNLIKASPEIQARKPAGVVQLVQQLIHYWNRKFTLDSQGVEHPVVNAEPPRTIFLVDQEHWGRESTRAWLYHA